MLISQYRIFCIFLEQTVFQIPCGGIFSCRFFLFLAVEKEKVKGLQPDKRWWELTSPGTQRRFLFIALCFNDNLRQSKVPFTSSFWPPSGYLEAAEPYGSIGQTQSLLDYTASISRSYLLYVPHTKVWAILKKIPDTNRCHRQRKKI